MSRDTRGTHRHADPLAGENGQLCWSPHPGGRVVAALHEFGSPFLLLRDDPRHAIKSCLDQRDMTLVDATRTVASGISAVCDLEHPRLEHMCVIYRQQGAT